MLRPTLPIRSAWAVLVLALPAASQTSSRVAGPGGNGQTERIENSVAGQIDLETCRIPFVANVGQADKSIGFHAQTFGGTVLVTIDGGILYSIPAPGREKGAVSRLVLRERLAGAESMKPEGRSRTNARVSYFIGNDPAEWRAGIPTYETVHLGDVYEGIELELEARGNNVEKRFFVRPGASPQAIAVRLDGIAGLRRSARGQLEVETEFGVLAFTRPVAYQEGPNGSVAVEVEYTIDGSSYGFAVGDYDLGRALIIDPLIAATYYGGSLEEYPSAICLDSVGNVLVAGYTESPDLNLPGTPGACQSLTGANDVFVSKFDAALGTLIASTYLGGDQTTGGGPGSEGLSMAAGSGMTWLGLALDGNDNVYVSGMTTSWNFPVVNPLQLYMGDWDVFVSRLDSSLGSLQASTFLGGVSEDKPYRMVLLDVAGAPNVYVTGYTRSTGFPTTAAAFQKTYPGGYTAVFVSKLKLDLASTTLVASTFLGGTGGEQGKAIAASSDGDIFVTGMTSSTNFPMATPPNPFQQFLHGTTDAFVARLSGDLSRLVASTYLGGTTIPSGGWTSEQGRTICVDGNGNVFVAGQTGCTDFPTTALAYDTVLSGVEDCFLSKLDGGLTSLQSSTFVGGDDLSSSNIDFPGMVRLGTLSEVILVGSTNSPDFPVTANALDPVFSGGFQGFVSRFDNDLNALLYSTFLDGGVFAVTADGGGNAYVAGTASSGFPTTPGAYQPAYNPTPGNPVDAFIAKIHLEPGTSYCFGDLGSGTPCPCANDNNGSIPGSGCANGHSASGARLTGSGGASITADSVVLSTTHLEPGNSGLYFQADNDLSPGIVWGDGLRCAGGNLKRLGVRIADGSGFSDTSGLPLPISVKAGNVAAGVTKYYQCWYRNPLNSPCGQQFNTSNGYAVTWLP